MHKLLEKFRANPTFDTAKALTKYIRKHPFSIMVATTSDQSMIDQAEKIYVQSS